MVDYHDIDDNDGLVDDDFYEPAHPELFDEDDDDWFDVDDVDDWDEYLSDYIDDEDDYGDDDDDWDDDLDPFDTLPDFDDIGWLNSRS